MNKPILNFCCCCCDLKIGSCIYVAFTIVSSIFIALFAIGVSLDKNDKNEGFKKEAINIPSFVLVLVFISSIATIVMSILFFNAVSAKKSKFLLPLIIFRVVEIVTIFMIVVIIIIIRVINDHSEDALEYFYYGTIYFIVHIYLTICLHSFYIKMKFPIVQSFDITAQSNNRYHQFMDAPDPYNQTPHPPASFAGNHYVISLNPPSYIASMNEQNK